MQRVESNLERSMDVFVAKLLAEKSQHFQP